MKMRWMMSLLAAAALLAMPIVGTADEDGKDEAKTEKCCDKAGCDKADCKDGTCCKKEGASCCKSGKSVAVKLDNIMCPISGHDIDEESTVDHNGGKVYLCCDHCADAWKKDMADDGKKTFLAKANYQLVATGQAKQKGCPMSGGKVKEGTQIKVGTNKVEVGFCCKNCTKKADSKEGDDLLAMIFGEKQFAKAFLVGDEKEDAAK